MAEADVDPYLKPLFDLLGAGPSPVPLPRRRPGTEPLTPEQIRSQSLAGSESMRQLGMRVNPVAWDKMLAESPDSKNIEDRRNDTVAQTKDRFRKDYIAQGADSEVMAKLERWLETHFGPDNPVEVNPRGPQ